MKKIFFALTVFLLLSSPCLALGEWNLTGSLNQGRSQFCSVMLDDGLILVAGGSSSGELSSCELYNPITGQWSITDSMYCYRRDFSLTKLPDGKILATGGYNGGNGPSTTISEIYDPYTETWTTSGELNYFRGHHTTTLLENDKVLVIGGDAVNDYKGCEIYDPDTELFSLTGFCSYAKTNHTTELLSNGKVMAIGGGNSSYEHCEIYDLNTETWIEIAPLNEPRYDHTSHLLSNGNVIVIAGRWGNHYNNSCEIYDFTTEQWSFVDSLEIGRAAHCSESLLNNKILVMGGHSDQIGTDMTCEIYDYENSQWQMAAPLIGPILNNSSEILRDERVLAIGQYHCEIYTWNYQPSVSQPQGPNSGTIGETLSFSVVASDPDGDSVSVRIDWGNGEITDWSDTTLFSYSWNEPGTYQIKSQVADQWYFLNELCHNSLSDWTDPVIITITGIPEIQLSADSLNFGSVYIGLDSTKTVAISNTGNGILGANLSTTTNEFTVWPENFNLEPSETLNIEITFTPSYEGIIADTLTILSNDPENPEVKVSLIGEGQIQVGIDDEFKKVECVMNNFPNPFNPSTTIYFNLTTESTESTKLIIYNLKGQKVRVLELASPSPYYADGVGYSISWDGRDDNNLPVGSGIYFYKLMMGKKEIASNKMLLLK